MSSSSPPVLSHDRTGVSRLDSPHWLVKVFTPFAEGKEVDSEMVPFKIHFWISLASAVGMPSTLWSAQWGAILTIADGTPRTPSRIGDLTNTGFGSYPDATGVSPIPSDRSAQRFWNIAAFNATNPQLAYRYGNTMPSVLLKPGTSNWDFSAMKDLRIIEGHSLQFRFESFNFANHPRWNAPGSGATSPSANAHRGAHGVGLFLDRGNDKWLQNDF
jgi:hypothetical protein